MIHAGSVGQDEIISFGGIAGISITAFSETEDTHGVLRQCSQSRHFADVRFTLETGGIAAAIAAYQESQSPHILIVETHLEDAALMEALDRLADACEADTRLILLGTANDVKLYRDLVRRGVSEYIPTPITVRQAIRAIAEIEEQDGGLSKGRVFAFTGASGGCGSSTMAASVAWLVGQRKRTPVTLVDLDVEFGSLGLSLSINAMRGVADALRAGTRLDSQLLEGLLQEYDEFLRVLAAVEPTVEEPEFGDEAVDRLIEVARSSASYVVLDVPALRTSMARRAVLSADQVFVTATPDLVSLRNTKKLFDTLRRVRPDESDPFLILNKIGASKKHEVPVKEIVGALNVTHYATVNYEPGIVVDAANNGKNVMQLERGHALLSGLETMMGDLVGAQVKARNGLLPRLTDGFRKLSRLGK